MDTNLRELFPFVFIDVHSWFKSGGMPWTRTTLPVRGAHCLANRSGTLVRLTFHDWCPRQDSHLHWRRSRRRVSALDYAGEKIGAPGQGCTGTARILSPLPLLLGYGSGRSADSHVRANPIARKLLR